jgi:hypothetical protein
MAKTTKEIIHLIQTILTEHDDFYDHYRSELRKYRDVYENKFWNDQWNDDAMIRVETADCYSYIEGFIASLFSRNPAVVISKDPAMSNGEPILAQEIVNRFLFDKREAIETASRLALIYPNSFLKLSPVETEDVLEKVDIRAIPPWEIIVDTDASSWNTQRFCGHVYYLDVPSAKAKFGDKQFKPIPKVDYFNSQAKYKGYSPGQKESLPDEYLYVQIVELYDFAYDKLYIWTPNWANGEQLLEKSEIPIRSYDNKPLSPICPLYFANKPERPMCGLSAVSRAYDQFYEKNILRTYWANAVRRDSRQYIYKEGSMDEEALAKITAGIDGAMIAVDEPSLDGVIRTVGVEPISTNFDRYQAQIEADINRSSILAPFSRGEASKATATEVTALAQYSASEIGKLARQKDQTIEMIATVYLRIISLLVDAKEVVTIDVNGLPTLVTTQDLDAKFKIVALDQSSTPLSESIKKNNLVSLAPTLIQFGVPPQKILKEIQRLFDFPKDFLPEEQAQQAQQPMQQAPQQAQGVETQTGDIGPQGQLPAELLAQALQGRK